MDDIAKREGISAALACIPSGVFILTACHEDRRSGVVCRWVQQACLQPPMVTVGIAKGQPILPLISESRRFGLCQVAVHEKILARKFANGFDSGEDPFLGMDLLNKSTTKVPLLANVLAFMECEVACHMDVEGDHDIFVGRVLTGAFIKGEPVIHVSAGCKEQGKM